MACVRDHCTGSAPLCAFCVEAALTKPLLAHVKRLGERWGASVHRRRPEGTWPQWDNDATGRLRGHARELVARLHTDPTVLDRLARRCAWCAGEAYRDAQRRSTPEAIAAERALRDMLRGPRPRTLSAPPSRPAGATRRVRRP